MKKQFILFGIILFTSTASLAITLDERAANSRKVIKEFAGQLKGKLQEGMKKGGPVNAVNVCKTEADGIAQKISTKYGWEISRTSLKTRNADNAPDKWEKNILEDFEKRKDAGEDPTKIEHFKIVNRLGKQYFRYMKAIPTGGVCLSCHGEKLDPKLTTRLDKLYPEDKARGFALGDLRGAFTITQPLD